MRFHESRGRMELATYCPGRNHKKVQHLKGEMGSLRGRKRCQRSTITFYSFSTISLLHEQEQFSRYSDRNFFQNVFMNCILRAILHFRVQLTMKQHIKNWVNEQ